MSEAPKTPEQISREREAEIETRVQEVNDALSLAPTGEANPHKYIFDMSVEDSDELDDDMKNRIAEKLGIERSKKVDKEATPKNEQQEEQNTFFKYKFDQDEKSGDYYLHKTKKKKIEKDGNVILKDVDVNADSLGLNLPEALKKNSKNEIGEAENISNQFTQELNKRGGFSLAIDQEVVDNLKQAAEAGEIKKDVVIRCRVKAKVGGYEYDIPNYLDTKDLTKDLRANIVENLDFIATGNEKGIRNNVQISEGTKKWLGKEKGVFQDYIVHRELIKKYGTEDEKKILFEEAFNGARTTGDLLNIIDEMERTDIKNVDNVSSSDLKSAIEAARNNVSALDQIPEVMGIKKAVSEILEKEKLQTRDTDAKNVPKEPILDQGKDFIPGQGELMKNLLTLSKKAYQEAVAENKFFNVNDFLVANASYNSDIATEDFKNELTQQLKQEGIKDLVGGNVQAVLAEVLPSLRLLYEQSKRHPEAVAFDVDKYLDSFDSFQKLSNKEKTVFSQALTEARDGVGNQNNAILDVTGDPNKVIDIPKPEQVNTPEPEKGEPVWKKGDIIEFPTSRTPKMIYASFVIDSIDENGNVIVYSISKSGRRGTSPQPLSKSKMATDARRPQLVEPAKVEKTTSVVTAEPVKTGEPVVKSADVTPVDGSVVKQDATQELANTNNNEGTPPSTNPETPGGQPEGTGEVVGERTPESALKDAYFLAKNKYRDAQANFSKVKEQSDELQKAKRFLGLFDNAAKQTKRAEIEEELLKAQGIFEKAKTDFETQRAAYLSVELVNMMNEQSQEIDVRADKEGKWGRLAAGWKALGDMNLENYFKGKGSFQGEPKNKKEWALRFLARQASVRALLMAGVGGIAGAAAGAAAGGWGSFAAYRGLASWSTATLAGERAGGKKFESSSVVRLLGVDPFKETQLTKEMRDTIQGITDVGQAERCLSDMQAAMITQGFKTKETMALDMPPAYEEIFLRLLELKKESFVPQAEAPKAGDEVIQAPVETTPQIVLNEEESEGESAELDPRTQAILDYKKTLEESADKKLKEFKWDRLKAAGWGTAFALGAGAAAHYGVGKIADVAREAWVTDQPTAVLEKIGHTQAEYAKYAVNWQERLENIRGEINTKHTLASAKELSELRNIASWKGTELGTDAENVLKLIDRNPSILENSGIHELRVPHDLGELSLGEYIHKYAPKLVDDNKDLISKAETFFGTGAGELKIHGGDVLYFNVDHGAPTNMYFAGDSGHALGYQVDVQPDTLYAPIYENVISHHWGTSDKDGLYGLLRQKGSETLFHEYYGNKVGYLSGNMEKRLDDYIAALRHAKNPNDMSNPGVVFFKAFMENHSRELLSEEWAQKILAETQAVSK